MFGCVTYRWIAFDGVVMNYSTLSSITRIPWRRVSRAFGY
jgi:hypothetical protein